MSRAIAGALFTVLLATAAYAQDAPSPSQSVDFAPTQSITASAPGPQPTRVREGPYYIDSLANTNTSYNQIQTLGVYNAAHVAPIPAITNYLAGVANNVTALQTAYSPNSTQYTQAELYNQLEFFGARQFHFQIYYDPSGTNYTLHAGLKIVNQSADTNATQDKWGYPGWKIMGEPNFDFNSTCITFATCLDNLNNWLFNTPGTAPITIFVEPSVYTYTPNGTNQTFASALARSNQTGPPDSLAVPLDPANFSIPDQAWRDLENEIQGKFNFNKFFTIVTPDDFMGDEDNLKEAVLKDGFTLYPALKDLRNRVIFVLTGDYVQNYLDYYPDLKNATLFVAEPYNADLNFTDSTLFVDVLGPLSGVNTSQPLNVSSNTAANATKSQVDQINKAVKAGYMVRAAADWQTYEPRYNYSARSIAVLGSGAHFVQTSFPIGPTLFSSSYITRLPIRGNTLQAARCNPQTTGGVIFNATEVYTVGCPKPNNLGPAASPSSVDSA